MHVTAIIAAAGAGRRAGADEPKQLIDIGGGSMLARTFRAFQRHPRVTDIILVVPQSAIGSRLEGISPAPGSSIPVVAGGTRRQDSVANAFDLVRPEADVVLIHDAARPFVSAAVIDRAIAGAIAHGAAIAAVPSHDTVKRVEAGVIRETIPRDTIYLAQTPQAFRREVLAAAVAAGRSGIEATDEAALAEHAGFQVHVVEGDPGNVKITTAQDLEAARERVKPGHAPGASQRIGTGYDLHRLVEGRPLVIGGVTIPSDRGPLGHSDGDVACHAATDAILGALSLGDIGRHFPDTDPKWKGADSLLLLRQAGRMARAQGYEVANLDITVILERPKIHQAVDRMRLGIAHVLEIDKTAVSVKGKTNEGVDAVGRGEAIASHAVALLKPRTSTGSGGDEVTS
jgi:2-C-methyl-D-erythritol 4-phosphate cytidylyltransferase / 2-C-methyl-D-erythritol 2,4-cyclodiphosphate synthase